MDGPKETDIWAVAIAIWTYNNDNVAPTSAWRGAELNVWVNSMTRSGKRFTWRPQNSDECVKVYLTKRQRERIRFMLESLSWRGHKISMSQYFVQLHLEAERICCAENIFEGYPITNVEKWGTGSYEYRRNDERPVEERYKESQDKILSILTKSHKEEIH